MRTLIAILLIALMPLFALGQTNEMFTIQGRVVDEETEKPLPWATVAITIFPDVDIIVKGVVTNENGEFKLITPKRQCIVCVRNLGYRNFAKHLSSEMDDSIDLGTIRMKMEPENLAMVTVKPLVEISADEITYNLMADPDRETSTLHAILDKVPLIKRTPMGDLYVGDLNKRFLIVRNGKKDALFEGNINDILKAIPAKGFATVTVMLAPPEHYGNYDYVVNITTDKNARLYGAIGLVSAEENVSAGTINPEGTLMTSLNKVRANIGVDFTNTNAPKSTNTIQYEYANGDLLRQKQENNRSGEAWVAGIMFSTDLAKEHFANWRFAYGQTHQRDKSYTDSYLNNQNRETSYSIQREKIDRWGAGIEYQYDIGDTKQVLNVAYEFSLLPNDKEDYASLDSIANRTEEKQQEQALQIHYYNPLSKSIRLEAGIGYIYRDYFQEVSENGKVINKFDDNKHIVNAYARLNYSKKRFSASANLKIDYLNDGDGALLVTGGQAEHISNTGIHFMPEARVSYSFSQKTLSRISLNYELLHSRPPLRMLSIYEDHSNPNYVIKGNPDLEDQIKHFLSFQTNIKKWHIMLGWQYSGNPISTYWYKDKEQQIIQTYANQGYDSQYGITANYSGGYKNWRFSIMSSANYSHGKMAQGEKEKMWYVYFNFTTSHTFPKMWNIGLSAGYHDSFSKGYSSYGTHPFSLALDIRKQFLKDRGELEIRYSDLLHYKSKVAQEVNASDFTMNQEIRATNVALQVTLKLRIGSYKVKPVRQIRKGVVIDDIITE